jgi:alkylation response protein AidB-like acyl-CoA dehydrogenase
MLNRSVADIVPMTTPDPRVAAQRVAALCSRLAAARDCDGSIPGDEVAALATTGLLHAPLPAALGGCELGMGGGTALALRDVLRSIGGGSLSVGRLYEGHVNAVRLITRFGTSGQLLVLAQEAAAGRLSAVWNAQTGDGLRLSDGRLRGAKIYTSGVGIVRRPVLTAASPDGIVMVMPDVAAARAELGDWTPRGMRASMTGRADFTGIAVGADDVIGMAGDYYRAPHFAGGAWRVLAVQLGGLEQLLALYREQMGERGRSDDPVQRARFGEAVAQLETARLWTARAAVVAEDAALPAKEIDALVNLARHAFERAALLVIERVERGIGLGTMLRPDPIERIVRDLQTYLRQPFPDAALDAAAGWALTPRPAHRDIGADRLGDL